ncbi:hypothetical protein [Crystallibacter degradans]|uniref:hypothetical protein n=1 Tax=Crystallibacter degradans TaxID=2726743 RepID=UPI001474D57A|nr:hypothetical protein [Arthrobacter sp. SF27]NMR32168.1 hypothetical protein [Arthrobacter sp. SF27]
MIRLTRRPAAMLQRVGSWRSILAGFALMLLVAGVVSVCFSGHLNAGERVSVDQAPSAGHDHLEKREAGQGIEPSVDAVDSEPHGRDRRHNCCSHQVPPTIEAVVQRSEEHPPPAVPAPVLTDPPLPSHTQSPGIAGPAPRAPSLIQLSISRT